MSTITDNITLGALSLKKYIKDYLDDNDWLNKYSIYLAGDPALSDKEIVETVKDKNKEIGLPLILIDVLTAYNVQTELGNADGTDLVPMSILVLGKDDYQMLTLGNLIRKQLKDETVITVYDFNKIQASSVGTAVFNNAVLGNISDVNSEIHFQRHASMINVTMEINSEDFI